MGTASQDRDGDPYLVQRRPVRHDDYRARAVANHHRHHHDEPDTDHYHRALDYAPGLADHLDHYHGASTADHRHIGHGPAIYYHDD